MIHLSLFFNESHLLEFLEREEAQPYLPFLYYSNRRNLIWIREEGLTLPDIKKICWLAGQHGAEHCPLQHFRTLPNEKWINCHQKPQPVLTELT